MTAEQMLLPEFDPDLQRCISCGHPVLEEGRTRHVYCKPPDRIPCDCGLVFVGPDRIARFVAHFDETGGTSTHDRRIGAGIRSIDVPVCGGAGQ